MLTSFFFNDCSETFPNVRSNSSTRIRHHLIEIDGKKFSLFTNFLSADEDSVDVSGGDTKVKLPWEVASIEISWRMIVEKEEISEAAWFKTTNRVSEELAGNEGVVAEEEVERLHSSNARILSLKLVDEAAAAVLLEHIVGHTISAKTDADALCEHVSDARHTDGVVLIAFGVGNDVSVGTSDDIDLVVVQEDTVADDGVLAEHAELLETRDAAHSVNAHALVLIVLTLGDVDVETSVDAREVLAELLNLGDGFLQSLVAAGEGCVKTKGGTKKRVLLLGALAHETDVLLNALLGSGNAVTIGNLVAKASTAAAFSGGTSNVVERAHDAIRTGVVVNNAGSTAFKSFSSENLGAVIVGFFIESTIKTPP